MRILHVNKFFDLNGGAEVYMHELIRRQREAGHETHAFSTTSEKNLRSDDAGRFVTRYDYSKRESIGRDIKKSIAFISNREARDQMKRALAELKPDVVHLHNIYHHLSTSILDPIRASGVRCVQTLHDYKLACPNYKMFTEGAPCERCKGGKYLEAVAHQCLFAQSSGNLLGAIEMGWTKFRQSYEKTVHTFICPSEFMKQKMIEWGEPPSKFTVVKTATDLPAELALRDGGYLLSLGRVSAEKGLETLVRAIARVPEMKLKIAGIGAESERLRSIAAELHATNIEFLGFVRSQDLPNLKSHAMALAVPSVWYENAPQTVLDAGAAGLPVIASDICGLPELVDAENGMLVRAGDVDAWGVAVREFGALSSEQRDRMSHAARVRIETQHQWSAHLDALENIYRV